MHAAIKFFAEGARRTSGRGHDHEAVLLVGVVLRLRSAQESDELAVGAPGQMLAVGRVGGGDFRGSRAGTRFDYKDIVGAGLIRLLFVIADEGDARAVGRPYRLAVLKIFVNAQRIEFFCFNVEEIQVLSRGGG